MNWLFTNDFSRFGYRELEISGKLLAILSKGEIDYLVEGITLNFNANSGLVFLSDVDYNVGVLDDTETKIIRFYSCQECGYEGTQQVALEEGKDFTINEGFCSKECAS